MNSKPQSKNIQKIPDIIEISSCPHCLSTSIFRNGHKNGKQQYKCKQCKKNFFCTTGTPTHWIHLKDKLQKYSEALMLGMSIRAAAKYVNISKNTSFNWRHKLLSSIKNEPLIKDSENTCAITLYKTQYSNKGRKKAPEKVRKNSKTLIITQNNQLHIQKLDNKRTKNQLIKILTSKKTITTLPNKDLTTVIKNLPVNQILKQTKNKNKLKIEISQQTQKLETWMKRFRGVATKYLQQYWNWFCGLHNIKNLKNEKAIFFKLCTENKTLNTYKKLIIQ